MKILLKQLGASCKKEHKIAYARSKHWNGKVFENLSKTEMDINLKTLPGLIQENFKGRKARDPKQNLPMTQLDKDAFKKDGNTKFVWFGHSAMLLQFANKNFLIDPMLGPDASPIGPVRTKRYTAGTLGVIDTLPEIDAVLLTHDHYDHLDLQSIELLGNKVSTWYVGLGIKRHLVKWGIPAEQITEFDWWEELELDGLKLVYTPSRHFSGRGLADRAKSLWGGWVFISEADRVYWSGDGGYDTHFKEVGEKYGPFSLGFMECGQYNKLWHHIHMYPEEAVQAAMDAQVKKTVPVHWGGFTLALHHWKEPVERFTEAAAEKEMQYLTPQIGAVTTENSSTKHWWEKFK